MVQNSIKSLLLCSTYIHRFKCRVKFHVQFFKDYNYNKCYVPKNVNKNHLQTDQHLKLMKAY